MCASINTQGEAPGHGKLWLDGKTGSNKQYCKECMCSVVTPEVVTANRQKLSAKWIERNRESIPISPAAECVRILSDPTCINGIKSKEMQVSCKGKALVERNNYKTYTMDDVPDFPHYKIVFPKGKFNKMRAYFDICTDPDLGVGYAALCCIACGCALCKEQLGTVWVM
jgi:hypothetical protein